MDSITAINIFQLVVFCLIIVLAGFYVISILCFYRIYHSNNIFTINLCCAAICCCLYWIWFYIILIWFPRNLLRQNICIIMAYFNTMCTIQVPLAVLIVSIHRFCCVIYHTKQFFKTKKWALLCITIQWLVGCFISIPCLPFKHQVKFESVTEKMISNFFQSCTNPLWSQIYQLTITVIVPSLICLVINLLVFNYVRLSSNRIRPVTRTESIDSKSTQSKLLTRRDRYLLRNIIIMFCVFIGGWSPVYITVIVLPTATINSLTLSLLILLAEFSLLSDIINLYIYNRDLRIFWRNKFFQLYL